MKIFMFLVNTFYWIGIFIIPAGILGFVGLWYYIKSNDNLFFSIIIGSVGLILGIIFAEFIRRKYGLDNFFGRISSTPDIDGGNILDETNKKKSEESNINDAS